MSFIQDLKEQNRWKHALISLIGSLFLTIGFAVGANFATEYKDKSYGQKWDWKDIGFGMLGGLLGQIIQIILIIILF